MAEDGQEVELLQNIETCKEFTLESSIHKIGVFLR